MRHLLTLESMAEKLIIKMYPRHTGDFALLRAYTAKDGSSKEYDEDNIPYKSDSFLKVSAKGVDEDDFVMVVGYQAEQTDHYF